MAKSNRSTDLEKALSESPEDSDSEELEAPTSNDVGKQTLTKADMGGRDVTKEGVPEEEFASPRHPDDPSGDLET